jgi:hypothetical protein
MLLWLPCWLVPTWIQIQDFSARRYHRTYQAIIRFLLFQAATLPLLVAALSLRGYVAGGLRWFALSLIVLLIVALFNAWVMLVEILR